MYELFVSSFGGLFYPIEGWCLFLAVPYLWINFFWLYGWSINGIHIFSGLTLEHVVLLIGWKVEVGIVSSIIAQRRYHPANFTEVKHPPLRIVFGWKIGRKELELIMWSVIINSFSIRYTLNVCARVSCPVISAQ